MSFPSILYQLFISPITLILEAVYSFSFFYLRNCGAAIIPLSLAVNLLLLPFYNRADAIQNEERVREKKMEPFVTHIKKTFKGDERYMLLQAYYRQNNYKPVYALRSTFALLLEIPFFIAAYRFLTNLSVLKGADFLILHDLGQPDALIKIAGISINVLPILMTLINIVSSEIFTHGQKLKEKLQLHGMALIFLVLLYDSPSGLVFYWTLNNLFSLIKNIVARFYKPSSVEAPAFEPIEHEGRLFMMGALFLSILTGLLIPSAVIQSSPSEFVLLSTAQSPIRYIFFAFLTASGTFLLWGGLFYFLTSSRGKRFFTIAIWAFAITGIINYMFYGRNTYSLSTDLQFDVSLGLSLQNRLINLALTIIIISLVILLFKAKKVTPIRFIAPILVVAIGVMSGYNIVRIHKEMPKIRKIIADNKVQTPVLSFSRKGQNVIVFMLDRGISSYVPYVFQDNPSLAGKFDGFTWYPNTLSFGSITLTGAPALYGGYDYRPQNSNLRKDLSLKDKHDEALLTMPILFSEAGYDVTVCDPPYAGYSEIPDLSVFDDYPSFKTYNLEYSPLFRDSGEFDDAITDTWNRNFYCYGLMKICPLLFQPGIYANGSYLSTEFVSTLLNDENSTSKYHMPYGIMNLYLYSYEALKALPEISIADNSNNAFFMMQNCAAHNPILLQEPDYVPVFDIDNTEYDAAHTDRFTYNGVTLPADTLDRMSIYHGHMAALMLLGDWMDKLRELGVYDNTRIIIVADHGYQLNQFDSMIFGDGTSSDTLRNSEDAMGYNPILFYKDFGSSGEFKTDYSFMTNADTPYLALNGIVDDPVSPFTGNPLFQQYEKNAEKLYVIYSVHAAASYFSGNTYKDITWYSLSNQNIFDKENWQKEEEP